MENLIKHQMFCKNRDNREKKLLKKFKVVLNKNTIEMKEVPEYILKHVLGSKSLQQQIFLISKMWVSGHFGLKNSYKKKSALFTEILNYTKFPCIIFCDKMSQYYDCTYCLQE